MNLLTRKYGLLGARMIAIPNRGMITYQLICATTPFRRKDDFEPVMITKIETLMKRFIHKHPHNPTESYDEET